MAETAYQEQETVWLCGKPRFLRELLGYVLKQTLGTVEVRDVLESEPPRLALPEYARWLIWFLNSKNEVAAALEKLELPSIKLNLLLIEKNGDTLVRWADGTEAQYVDISLRELENLVQPQPPSN